MTRDVSTVTLSDGLTLSYEEQGTARARGAAAGPYGLVAVLRAVAHTPRWDDASRFAADVGDFVQRLVPPE